MAGLLLVGRLDQTHAASAKRCDSFQTRPDVALLAGLLHSSELMKIYPDTNVREWNTVVIDKKDEPGCAVKITSAGTSAFEFPEAREMAQPFLSFFRSSSDVSRAFKKRLFDQGISDAVVIETNQINQFRSTWVGKTSIGKSPAKLLAFITLHEAFHIYRFMNVAAWTEKEWQGMRMEARRQWGTEEINKKCYSASTIIKKLVRQELSSLTLAARANSALSQSTYLRRFVSARKERYGLIDPVCVSEEKNQELLEGSANFFAFNSLLAAKVVTFADLQDYLKASITQSLGPAGPATNEAFYELGMMQLMNLKNILSSEDWQLLAPVIDQQKASIFESIMDSQSN
ncbi:MAG: hypothetical protein EOP06_20665 [Proteobacteria bacterium]|nr:MAG: hypothetical protein EOP06_20665 [Pseudomonadota bacterium]